MFSAKLKHLEIMIDVWSIRRLRWKVFIICNEVEKNKYIHRNCSEVMTNN